MTGGIGGNGSDKVEMDFDIGGDAAETLEKIAKDAEKVADQEERYQKLLAKSIKLEEQRKRLKEDMVRLGVKQSQEDRKAQAEADRAKRRASYNSDDNVVKRRMEAADQSKRVRERLQAAGYGPRKQAPLTEMQEAGRRILAGEREERIQKMMDRLAPKKGLAGLAQKAEGKFGLARGSLSGIAGKVEGMGGPAAGVGMMLMAGKFALDTGVTVSDQMQYGNPYADDFVRGREQVQNVPYARQFYALSDLVTGRSKAMKKENRRKMEEDIEGRFESERHELSSEQWRKERVAQLNTRTVQDIPLPGMASTARSTQTEKRQYDLAQRLLPLQERRAEAERASAEAMNEQTTNLERLKKQEEYIAGLRRKKADIEGRFQGGQEGSVPYVGALGDLTRVGKQIEEAEKSHAGLRERVQQGAVNVASARYQSAQAGIAESAGQLDDLRRREGVASSQNQRLAFGGREGRAMAIHWKRMADQFDNISDLPPEAISTLQQFFPEFMQQKGEQEGERFRRDFSSLSSEYRDSVPGIRKQVDAAEGQVRGQKETASRDYKDAVFEGMKQYGLPELREFGTEIMKQVNRQIKDEKDRFIYEQMLKAYNLPGGGG